MSNEPITIRVVFDVGNGGANNVPTPTPTPNDAGDNVQEQTKKSNKTLGAVVANQLWEQTKANVKNIATYSLNRYFNLTEDYISEQNVNNAITAINKTMSFGTAVIGGAIVGASFGPVGAAITTIISTASWVINDAVEKTKRWQTARLSQENANYNREFSSVRAGLIDGSKGTMN